MGFSVLPREGKCPGGFMQLVSALGSLCGMTAFSNLPATTELLFPLLW